MKGLKSITFQIIMMIYNLKIYRHVLTNDQSITIMLRFWVVKLWQYNLLEIYRLYMKTQTLVQMSVVQFLILKGNNDSNFLNIKFEKKIGSILNL